MDDCYFTIKSESEAETKVKSSRFIARANLAASLDDVNSHLESIRKKEHAASHNCYAYIIGPNEKERQFKYSDDGEPGGTAGRPIYDVVNGRKLTNILLVVTRYFGGTKLGTGGLVRAYGEVAASALDQAGIKENFISSSFQVEIEFTYYDSIMKLLTKEKVLGHTADFSEKVKLEIEIRRSQLDNIKAAIIELTNGQAQVHDK